MIKNAGVRKILYLRKQKQLITILNLHRISSEENFFWQPLSPENFEALVKYATTFYNVVHFNDIPKLGQSSVKPPLILSFDDGYSDFIQNALPILKKYNCKSNHNIVVDCVEHNATIWTQHLNHIFNELRYREHIGAITFNDILINCKGNDTFWEALYMEMFYKLLWKRQEFRKAFIEYCYREYFINPSHIRMMNWDEIRNCVANGVEIGNHTYSHDSFASDMTIDEMQHEIVESKKVIEKHIQQPCEIFSFPNGQFNDTVLNTVVGAGYKYLLFADNKFQARVLPSSISNPDFVSRINIVNESVSEMLMRIEGFHNRQSKRLHTDVVNG